MTSDLCRIYTTDLCNSLLSYHQALVTYSPVGKVTCRVLDGRDSTPERGVGISSLSPYTEGSGSYILFSLAGSEGSSSGGKDVLSMKLATHLSLLPVSRMR
jgi:hypothetical protein